MPNETATDIVKITYEEAIKITQNPYFFIPIISLVVLTFIIYLVWGAFASASTSKKIKAISTANFWIIFMIFFFSLVFLTLMIIFPIWLEVF